MFKYWVGLNQSNFCDNFLFLCKSGAFLYVRFTDEFLDNFTKQQCSQLRHPGLDGRSPEIEFVLVRSVKAYCASHQLVISSILLKRVCFFPNQKHIFVTMHVSELSSLNFDYFSVIFKNHQN